MKPIHLIWPIFNLQREYSQYPGIMSLVPILRQHRFESEVVPALEDPVTTCSHSRAIGNGLDRSAYEIYYDPVNLIYHKQNLLGQECAGCPPYTLTRWEIEVHAPKVLAELIKESVRRRRA